MKTEKTELHSGELFKGPLAVMATDIFLGWLIREITVGEANRYFGMDFVSSAILMGKVDPRSISVADHVAIAADNAAKERMHFVI